MDGHCSYKIESALTKETCWMCTYISDVHCDHIVKLSAKYKYWGP